MFVHVLQRDKAPAAASRRVFGAKLFSFFCLIAMQLHFHLKNNSRMTHRSAEEEKKKKVEMWALYFTAEAYRSQAAMGHSIGVMRQRVCVCMGRRECVCQIVGLP